MVVVVGCGWRNWNWACVQPDVIITNVGQNAAGQLQFLCRQRFTQSRKANLQNAMHMRAFRVYLSVLRVYMIIMSLMAVFLIAAPPPNSRALLFVSSSLKIDNGGI